MLYPNMWIFYLYEIYPKLIYYTQHKLWSALHFYLIIYIVFLLIVLLIVNLFIILTFQSQRKLDKIRLFLQFKHIYFTIYCVTSWLIVVAVEAVSCTTKRINCTNGPVWTDRWSIYSFIKFSSYLSNNFLRFGALTIPLSK